jgi:hypothetical protein
MQPSDLNSDGVVDALDLSTLVSNWGAVPSGSGTALLVTNESVLSAGNQALHDRLVTLGYSVITRLDSAPVDYSGIDVMVTGSITGSNINGKYAHPDVGLVCVDSWTHFGLGSSIGFQNTVTDIEVINDSSPLAGGLNSGIHTVYGTAGYLVWSTNYNAATATIIATNPGVPTNPIVFAYEAGSEMAGVYATTRHVGLGFHRLVRADTTASGWALFDAAVAWARSTTYVAPPPPSAPTNLSATASDTQVVTELEQCGRSNQLHRQTQHRERWTLQHHRVRTYHYKLYQYRTYQRDNLLLRGKCHQCGGREW